MKHSGPHRATLVVAGMAFVVLVLTLLAVLPAVTHDAPAPVWAVTVVAVIAWLGLLVLGVAVRSHFDDIRLLRSGMESVASGQLLPEAIVRRFADRRGSLGVIARLIGDLGATRHGDAARPDQRLAAVLGALHGGVVVVTESGLVSLINAPAKAVLGGAIGVGGSIYSALDRDGLIAAVYRSQRSDGKPVQAGLRTLDGALLDACVLDFGEHRGAVVTFAGNASTGVGEIELALDLHDQPPAAPAPVRDTLLSELPVVVLDTETTGLDVEHDAIVSIGAVRCHGPRVFRSTVLDRLVDPVRRIPARAIAIHGIDDAMVAGKPRIDAVLPEVLALMADTVVVGHNTGFDLALLQRAMTRAGRPWSPPPCLDILLLAAALDPEETALEIDDQAARLGINISGRHTALGDSLVTAELWVRLIPQLERRGVRTLGEALRFSRGNLRAVARQREMGWDRGDQLGGD